MAKRGLFGAGPSSTKVMNFKDGLFLKKGNHGPAFGFLGLPSTGSKPN